MAQTETLQKVLAAPADASRVKQLQTVHEAITASLSSQLPSARVGLETLVSCAEAALKVGSLDVAQDCLERYFLEQRRYGPGMAPLEVRDQYLCRAHFATGLLVSERSKGLKGRELIDGTLESIRHVMSGLAVAAANPRYQFMVYNASVHHWRVAAPLHRDGLRQHLLPSTEQMVQALDKVPGHEEWKVRCYTAQALCQFDAGKADEAAKTLGRAYDMAAAAKLPELQRDVARLQVHLATTAAAASGKGPKAGAAAGAAAKTGGKGAAAGVLDEEGALRLIQAVMSGRPDRAIAEQQLRDAVAKVDPKPDGPVRAALLRPVSRAAWAAALVGLPELAERWASRAAASSDSGPRTWSDMTRVLLSLQALGPTGDTSLAPAVIAVHVKALDALEDCLTTFTKLADVEGIHAAARLAWNAGLLLLQPPLRRHVKRAFNAAVRALAVAGSPLTRLRAALHLEAAKCDVAEEALIKAGQEVGKALALDYLPPPAEATAVPWLARPLDRWAVPLARSLALRTSAEPANPEEEALSLIERSKESRNPAIKADLLARAREKLRDLPHPQPPTATQPPPGPERSQQHEAARRRSAVWAELLRSAAASRMDEHVLAAAPAALCVEWEPGVDKEMVLLAAQMSYMEAEAAVSALRRQRADPAPPPRPAPQALDVEGMRQPPATPQQLQELVVLAAVRAMRAASSVQEHWLAINSAVLVYNAALSYMQQHRYADLYRWLRPVAEALVALPKEDSDGALAVAVAEALGRAAEHRLLLAAARAKAARDAGREEEEEEEDEYDDGIGAPHPGDAGPHFSRHSPGYRPLPDARVAAAGVDPRVFPSLAPLLGSLAAVTAVVEGALERAGGASTQGLLELYARLQQFRGVNAGLPAGAAAASEHTSKVVSAIEALAASRGGSKTPAALAAEAAAGVALLRSLPGGSPLELWAKMARAVADAGCWPAALECSAGALAALPGGGSPESPLDALSLEAPSDLPEMTPASWFWAAVALHVRGAALLSLVDLPSQGAATSLTVRRSALEHAAQAARCAAFVNKPDLCESAARLVWNAALPFTTRPLLRAALIRPLGVAVEALNRLGAADKQFQVRLNCLYVECLAAARRWGDAVAACDAGCRAAKPRSLHRPLLGWKAACLAALGHNVNAEMTKVKEHPPETQAYAWSVLAHHSAARYDQVAAHKAAIAAVGDAGWLKAVALAGYAEWLLSSSDDKEAAEDVLLAAADALLEFDTGDLDDASDDDEPDDPAKSRTSSRGGPGGAPGSRSSFRRVLSRSRSASQDGGRGGSRDSDGHGGGGSGGRAEGRGRAPPPDPNRVPEELGTTHLERLARIYTMACQAAPNATDHTDYMMAAHHNFMRLLTQALHSAAHSRCAAMRDAHHAAVAAAAVEGRRPPPEPEYPKPYALLPDTLVGWGTWELGEAQLQLLRADAETGVITSLSKEHLPQAELTMSYLELLQSTLRARGYHCHCLGLLQLQRVLAKMALRDESMYVASTLGLVLALDELGLSEEAGRLEAQLGGVAGVTEQEEAKAKEQAALAELVRSAAVRLEAARPRSALAVGRLSFLAGGVRRAAAAASAAAAPPLAPSAAAAAAEADAAAAQFSAATRAAGRESPSPDRQRRTADGAASAAGDGNANGGVAFIGPGMGGGNGADAVPLPEWMEEAARELGGVNLGGGGGLLSHVSGQLLLRPYTLHDVWLLKGEYLAKRGHYAAARSLLSRARAHAADCGNREAEARCLLALSRAELAARNPAEAVALVQAAQRLGGDIDFWADLLVQYVDCRLAGSYTTTADAREALQGGIAMFLALARDDRSAEKPASAAGAVLRVRLARLLLGDMVVLRQQGVSTWKKSYDQAVTLVNQAIMALAAREVGIPHIEALLVQAELMMADPTPIKDLRPRLKKVEKVLAAAEDMAVRFQTETTPRDLDPRVTTPTSRLLARVRCRLAEVQLAAAAARDSMAAADREKARPKFPKVRGKDAAVVIDFIDETGGDTPPPATLHPEDAALAAAMGAAALVAAAPRDRAQALLVAGRCLQFKFLRTVPSEQRPDRPFEPPPVPATPSPPGTANSNGVSASPSSGNLTGGASTRKLTSGASIAAGAAAAAAAAATAAADDAADEEDPELAEATAAAAALQSQAAALLSAALAAAVSVQDWPLAEQAAYELARTYGQQAPGLACRTLALAQACAAAAAGQALLRAAALPQQPEVLAAAQRDALAAALPAPSANGHYAALRKLLTELRGPVARLDVAAAPRVEAQLEALPPDLRVLMLYVSRDGTQLCAAALNIPDPAAPPRPPPTPAEEKARKKGEAPPAPAAPRVCLLSSVDLDSGALEALVADLKAHRRGVERQIRETISAAAARGIGVPPEDDGDRPGSPGKKGGRKPSSASKRPVRSPPTGAARSASGAPDAPARVDIFDPSISREWQRLLDRLDDWLSPLEPWLLSAVPPVPPPPPPSPDGKRDKAGGGSKAQPPAGPPKHKVALLLDPSLDSLPWEALPHLAANCACVSRAPSLQALAACHSPAPAASSGPPATPPTSPSTPGQLPPFDLGRVTAIVDPRHECSTPQQARGQYMAQLIPALSSPELLAVAPPAAYWLGPGSGGFQGSPGRAPSPDTYAALLSNPASSCLLFLGVGRFAAHVPPDVLAAADLSACDCALIFDRCNTDGAYWAQLYRDNRKSAAARRLESPARVARLLLARGVRTVVCCTAAAPPAAVVRLLTLVLGGVCAGRSVGEAAYGALTGTEMEAFELEHLKANLQVWGAPGLLGAVLTAGGKGKAGAKPAGAGGAKK